MKVELNKLQHFGLEKILLNTFCMLLVICFCQIVYSNTDYDRFYLKCKLSKIANNSIKKIKQKNLKHIYCKGKV